MAVAERDQGEVKIPEKMFEALPSLLFGFEKGTQQCADECLVVCLRAIAHGAKFLATQCQTDIALAEEINVFMKEQFRFRDNKPKGSEEVLETELGFRRLPLLPAASTMKKKRNLDDDDKKKASSNNVNVPKKFMRTPRARAKVRISFQDILSNACGFGGVSEDDNSNDNMPSTVFLSVCRGEFIRKRGNSAREYRDITCHDTHIHF